MPAFLQPVNRFIAEPIGLAARLMLLAAAALLVTTYFFPLWNLTMFAPQYPDGLRLDIYSYTLVGGNGGQDIKEINVLNHYIGMQDLLRESFTEFTWMPFVIGALGLLVLRAIVHGTLALFGTYTVDEAKKTLTFNITASTYPNQEGTSQTRTIDKLTADEFRNTNPGAARDGPALAANVYTRAK